MILLPSVDLNLVYQRLAPLRYKFSLPSPIHTPHTWEKMSGRLTNKVAIITGASSGIGRATALAYAREGAIIVCSDLHELPRGAFIESSTLTTMQEVQNLGAKALFVKCDTSKAHEVEALVQKTVQEFGRLDIMMNNAGVGEVDAAPIWDYEESSWDKVLAINLTGVFLGTKYAAKQMKDQEPHPSGDRGWIINLASVLGLNGTPGHRECTVLRQ